MLRTGRRTVSTSVRDNAESPLSVNCRRKRRNALPRILSRGSAMIKEWATVVSWENGQGWLVVMLKPHAAAALHVPVA